MIKKLLVKTDLLVEPYQFKAHKRQKSHTVTGGVLTILLIIFGVVYLVSIILKQLKNQQTIYTGTQADPDSQVILDQTTVSYLFEISSIDGEIFSNLTELSQYLKIQTLYIEQNRKEDILGYERNLTDLPISKCSAEIIEKFNFDKASLTTTQRENLLCSDGQYTLRGKFQDPFFHYIRLQVSVCSPATSVGCKPLSEIKKFLDRGINIDLFIMDATVKQSLNITAPAIIRPTNIFWRLSTGIANNEDLYLAPIVVDIKKSQVLDDVLNTQSNQNIFRAATLVRQERRQEAITLAHGIPLLTTESLYYFAIQNDWIAIFLSSLSEATALTFALMAFIKLFYRYYNRHVLFVKLMNKVYKFDMGYQHQKNDLTSNQKPSAMLASTTKLRQQQLDHIFNFKMPYSFCQFAQLKVKNFIKRFKKKPSYNEEEQLIRVLQMAKNKIESDLDLTHILKKLYEIDCLKLFLFDDDQLMVFNTFCSPVFQDNMLHDQIVSKALRSKTSRQLSKLLTRTLRSKDDVEVAKKDSDDTFGCRLDNVQDLDMIAKLAKISRFFRAELAPFDSHQLIEIFRKVEKNQNKNVKLNAPLLQFAKENDTLFGIISRPHSKPQPSEPRENVNWIPNELEKAYAKKDDDSQIVQFSQKSQQDQVLTPEEVKQLNQLF